MWRILIAVYVLSAWHGLTAILSMCIGIASSVNSDVWMAHRVSPIWSGGFFLLTAITGVLCAKKKTVYLIMCFAAFSVVSLVVAVVSIQLLKLGLVNHMSDGDTLKKDSKDPLVIMALATAGAEILICIISALVGLRVAYRAKKELHKKNEGLFSVTVLGEKDIIVHITKPSASYDKLSEPWTSSAQSIEYQKEPTGNECRKLLDNIESEEGALQTEQSSNMVLGAGQPSDRIVRIGQSDDELTEAVAV